MAAGEHADIIDLVVTTVEATTPLAVSGTPGPTRFRKSGGPTMEPSQSRQFEVVVDRLERKNDTGVQVAQVAQVQRAIAFRVVMVWRQGHENSTEFGKIVFEDVRRIQDRVVRAVREAGGGAFACLCDGEARPEPSEDPQSLFVSIPFVAHYFEPEYTSGA